ncbi:NAD(P)/FAD-dependent oxidoreductase [Tepidibacillus sp. LV47]|uniref:NAD(P)/FAD-dependent oxidoreductase n=1 Tax=Tepidibacillus sp. LV47 TaxID=3398228 RepID=UPI003AB0E364
MVDVIIVGGGVAGLSAAIFTANAGLNTLVLNDGKSQITRVSSVKNIPGFPEGISGEEWIKRAREQVEKFNGNVKEEKVIEVMKNEEGIFEVKTDNNSYLAKYLVIATNVNKDLLAPFGYEAVVNPYVPNNKAKSIPNIPFTGETSVENLYLAGLITEIPSQVSVALGQGAAVGIAIVSKEKGTPYMWHDI